MIGSQRMTAELVQVQKQQLRTWELTDHMAFLVYGRQKSSGIIVYNTCIEFAELRSHEVVVLSSFTHKKMAHKK